MFTYIDFKAKSAIAVVVPHRPQCVRITFLTYFPVLPSNPTDHFDKHKCCGLVCVSQKCERVSDTAKTGTSSSPEFMAIFICADEEK